MVPALWRVDKPNAPGAVPDSRPPMTDDADPSDELVDYYREILVTHGSVHGASMCHLCGVARCPDWVDAYDTLAAAGKLMGDAKQWGGPLPGKRL